ncbi:MAG: TRC40/GET3/ArsA family transport-energizing ATPase [Acetobacteraceae bacterium]|nr:TRC40/GET3/ArsA family transport-energizing ATPase [Acetobacteraceae bacterium]
MRVILYTGKGGVGKTAMAAATAIRAADLGHPTLVVSTDAAHSLADALGRELGPEPLEVAARLWAQEIDPLVEMERAWGQIREYLGRLFAWQGFSQVMVEELTVFPGMEELFNLLRIEAHAEDGRYQVLVVDCAPTGETLRLLSYPDVFRWWMERLFPLQRRAMKVLRPVAQPIIRVPLPGDEVFAAVDALFRRVLRTQALLTDPSVTSVRLVVNPEKMVIREAERSFTYLSLFGFLVDAVVVNRVLPAAVEDSYFDRWKQVQGEYCRGVEEYFAPVPVLYVPLFEEEVVGPGPLRRMGESCFGQGDPARFLISRRPQTVTREADGYVLHLLLPAVEKGRLRLRQKGEELTLGVGGFRRHLILPRALANLEAAGASLEGQVLRVRFREPGAETGGEGGGGKD